MQTGACPHGPATRLDYIEEHNNNNTLFGTVDGTVFQLSTIHCFVECSQQLGYSIFCKFMLRLR